MSIAAVVLAAGASRRLGRPKQSIVLAGESLLHRTIRIASEARLSPIIVITRPGAENIASPSSTIITKVNQNPDEGIASSIRCGISAASNEGAFGAVLLACDQPGLSAHHLRALIADPGVMTGSGYAGSIGVPAYFPAALFPTLLQLRGDTGARSLLKNARSIDADDLKLDIDTEEDLREARSLLEQQQSSS